MLMQNPDIARRLTSDKSTRIAIIGAGPSGVLFSSQHLSQNGYKNVKLFESSNRVGGKSYGTYKPTLGDAAGGQIPCKVGTTVYVSSAHFPMNKLYDNYKGG